MDGAVQGPKITSSCFHGATCLMEETDKKATVPIRRRNAMVEACIGCMVAHGSDNMYLQSSGYDLASFQEKVVPELHPKGGVGVKPGARM